MIVSIKKDDNVLDYDLSKIKDDEARRNSSIIVTKVGHLETISEAIRFAIDGHRLGLEKTLDKCEEALVPIDKEEKKK